MQYVFKRNVLALLSVCYNNIVERLLWLPQTPDTDITFEREQLSRGVIRSHELIKTYKQKS